MSRFNGKIHVVQKQPFILVKILKGIYYFTSLNQFKRLTYVRMTPQLEILYQISY